MDWLIDALRTASNFLPVLITLLLSILALIALRHFLIVRHMRVVHEVSVTRQLTMMSLYATAVVAVILALPISDSNKQQLLSLLGILLTAAIALSSTNFLGNAMAGLMLKAVRTFRTGDFLKVGTVFGRISEMGLLHTEVQTEERDLTTLPNLYLVTNPFTVIRSSGTIVSATVSLGYDVAQSKITAALKEAALETGLTEPFVQVTELGDFSVGYRLGGFLGDVKFIVSTRAQLRSRMLDALHRHDIEIVSPTFMNQRQLGRDQVIIPSRTEVIEEEQGPILPPEVIMFDKAEQAESKAQLQAKLSKIADKISDLKKKRTESEGEEDQAPAATSVEVEIAALESKREQLIAELKDDRHLDDDDIQLDDEIADAAVQLAEQTEDGAPQEPADTTPSKPEHWPIK